MASPDPHIEIWNRREVVALILLFLILFILLGLCSYILPLFAKEPVLQSPVANWCGSFGFYSAHYLFSFLGLIAFFPVCILCCATVTVLLSKTAAHRLPSIVAGITGIMISSSGLFGSFEELLLPSAFVQPGGYLGNLVWNLLSSVIGNVGSGLVLLLLLIFSLMAAVRFSPFGVVKWAWRRGAHGRRPLEQNRESVRLFRLKKRKSQPGSGIKSLDPKKANLTKPSPFPLFTNR